MSNDVLPSSRTCQQQITDKSLHKLHIRFLRAERIHFGLQVLPRYGSIRTSTEATMCHEAGSAPASAARFPTIPRLLLLQLLIDSSVCRLLIVRSDAPAPSLSTAWCLMLHVCTFSTVYCNFGITLYDGSTALYFTLLTTAVIWLSGWRSAIIMQQH